MHGHPEKKVSPPLVIGGLSLLLALTFLAAIGFGSSTISPVDIFNLVTGQSDNPQRTASTMTILLNVRLPRAIAAVAAGSALAVSGALIQTVLDNPMASPNIIGINAGAGLFVLVCSALLPGMAMLLPLAAFLGACAASLIIMAISVSGGASRLTLVLAGIAIGAVFTAGMNTILIVAPDAYVGAGTFLVGGFASGITLDKFIWALPYIILGLGVAVVMGKSLNIISLGDVTARSLGMNVKRRRIVLLAVATLLAAAAVSFAGLLGFVGLIIPHTVRFLLGTDNRIVIPASMLAGALYVLFCDLAARIIFAPYELPVGILMSFIGGPFFIFLIIHYRKRSFE